VRECVDSAGVRWCGKYVGVENTLVWKVRWCGKYVGVEAGDWLNDAAGGMPFILKYISKKSFHKRKLCTVLCDIYFFPKTRSREVRYRYLFSGREGTGSVPPHDNHRPVLPNTSWKHAYETIPENYLKRQ
jgi:hypothetical protein